MKKLFVLGTLALAGCTGTSTVATLTNEAVTDGQLFCSPAGKAIVAMVSPSGAAILAKGQTATYVNAACAAINAIPVPPPPTGTVVPTATVAVPSV